MLCTLSFELRCLLVKWRLPEAWSSFGQMPFVMLAITLMVTTRMGESSLACTLSQDHLCNIE